MDFIYNKGVFELIRLDVVELMLNSRVKVKYHLVFVCVCVCVYVYHIAAVYFGKKGSIPLFLLLKEICTQTDTSF